MSRTSPRAAGLSRPFGGRCAAAVRSSPTCRWCCGRDGDPIRLTGQLRLAVRDLDPSLAVSHVRLMDQIAADSFSTPRISLYLVVLFAALALSLAAIGIYGVVSYSVNQRMHEFGMRVALGAGPWHVMRLVMRQGVALTAIGAAWDWPSRWPWRASWTACCMA